MHDVEIVVHVLNWCVRSRSAVAIFHQFETFYCRLLLDASKEQYLSFRKFHLPIIAANNDEGIIKNSNTNEYFRDEIGGKEKESL